MKVFSKIAITFTVLILLMFGTGGVGFAKCSCSGKISLMIPMDKGCCPMESGCMTISVAHFSDYELQQNSDIPQPEMAVIELPLGLADNYFELVDNRNGCFSYHPPHPPTDIIGTVVLRV